MISKIIYTHPDNVALLRSRLPQLATLHPVMSGVDVFVNTSMPRTIVKWTPPTDPFIQYEKSDEVWLRGLGFGQEVDTGEPLFVMRELGGETRELRFFADTMDRWGREQSKENK